ncbi:MAG: sigma-70 family RNA polymerase sigma factor [Prevotella sp.]|nr:sigma-70 family RNA polymerase sigma factor [Prevotella sp.]
MLNNPTEQQDKEKLISRCKAGDRQALSLLYTHYRPYLLNICKHYAKENSVAEDLLHDAFIVILTSLDKLRDTDKLEAWMTTIVRNVGYHYWKHLDKEHTALKQMSGESQNITEGSIMPDYELMQKLVAQLPKGYQQVFRLSVFEGLSHQEISRMLNIAPHSSSSQLLHAKRMLQKLIRQSWVVILLLIAIPTAIWRFILKEKPSIEGNPTNPTQEAQITNNRQQKAQQEPTVEHTANHPVYVSISTTTTSQKPLQYQENSPILPDTIPQNNTEVQNDTKALASQSPKKESVQDTVTHRPVLQSDLTENGNTDMLIKTKTSAWNVQLAYNGQIGRQDNFMQETSVNAKSFSAISNILIPEETPYSNWNDYSFYLNNAIPQQDMTAETRSLMDIAASNAQINGGRMEANYKHQLPISLQLSLSRQLSEQLSVETGLSYTLLKSSNTTGSPTAYIQEQQRLHYLGIPLRMGWQWYNHAPLSLYTSAGVMMEVPVHSTLSVNHVNNGMNTYNTREKLSLPLQWSTSLGIGLQYDITPHIGFYIEPSLQYFFNDGSSIKSYRTEHRFNITLPLGIRLKY